MSAESKDKPAFLEALIPAKAEPARTAVKSVAEISQDLWSTPDAASDLTIHAEPDSLRLTKQHNHATELRTRTQSKSNLWHSLRRGGVTASHFEKNVSCKLPFDQLVSRLLNQPDLSNIPGIIWGRENEEKARVAYVNYQHIHGKINLEGFSIRAGFDLQRF